MIYSTILLVFVVATQPVQLRLVDRLSSFAVCEEVILQVVEAEKAEPENTRIGGRLQCISLSMVADQDGDGPSHVVPMPDGPKKPVAAPVNTTPMMNNSHGDVYKCNNLRGKAVACRDASYGE